MNFITDFIETLLIEVPMTISKVILDIAGAKDRPKRFCALWVFSLLLAGGAGMAVFHPAGRRCLPFNIVSFQDVLMLGVLSYFAYILFTLPLLLPFQFLKQKPFSKEQAKRYAFSRPQMVQTRIRTPSGEVFLGRSMKTSRPVCLTPEMRKMHTHVVGSTGAGKTDSIILPLVAQDIQRGNGVLIMDAKGDKGTLNKIHHQVSQYGREKDFLFFSLAYPEKSNTYNPLLRGNPTELKDKIISANVWTEEFYKKKSEETLLLLMKCLRELEEVATFQKLYELISSEKRLAELSKRLRNSHLKGIMQTNLRKYELFQKDLSGLTADLGMIAESEFADLLTSEKPQIDLLDAYLNKKIVYFQLNAQGYEETARRFGRIVLQDLKTISNHIQAYLSEEQRSFFPIFIDEFSNFAYDQFIEFLNKARGAHLGILIAHQSLGDLQKAGDYFLKQVLENCNIKIIMRQDDPESIETYAKISGTEQSLKDTYQTQEDFLDKSPTGLGTVREVEEFRIKPNMIRELGRGEAALIIKQPFVTDLLQLDYIGSAPIQRYVA